MPEIPQDLLAKIGANVEGMMANQKLAEEKAAQAAEAQKQLEAKLIGRIEAHDSSLQSQEKWLAEVDKKASAKRFGNGSGETDVLRNLLPDNFKAQIPRVEGTYFTSPSLREMIAKDPVMVVGSAAWFSCRLKAHEAHSGGKYDIAGKYMELADKLAEGLGGYQKVALQEDTSGDGGYLVPTVTEGMVGRVIKDYSIVRSSGPTMLQMTTKSHQLPTLANDFSVAIIAEEGTITDAAPAVPFGQGTLTAKKFAGLVTVAEELVADSAVNLLEFVILHMGEMLGKAQDIQALEGDGTGVNFTGLFAAAGVNSTAGGSVALTELMLRKLIFGGEWGSTTVGDVIYCHPWIVRDAMGLVTSGAIWYPYLVGSSSPLTNMNIWGVPTYKTAAISRVRTANDTTAYHGNPKGLVIGDRSGIEFKIDPYTKMDTAQLRLRLIQRTGILVWVPAYFTKLTAVTVLP